MPETIDKHNGKIVATMTVETVQDQPGLWPEIFDRLTITFTDGSKAQFKSAFCSTEHSAIREEG